MAALSGAASAQAPGSGANDGRLATATASMGQWAGLSVVGSRDARPQPVYRSHAELLAPAPDDPPVPGAGGAVGSGDEPAEAMVVGSVVDDGKGAGGAFAASEVHL